MPCMIRSSNHGEIKDGLISWDASTEGLVNSIIIITENTRKFLECGHHGQHPDDPLCVRLPQQSLRRRFWISQISQHPFSVLRRSWWLFQMYPPSLGKGQATKLDEFSEKCQRGGVIFNTRIYITDFGNFKQGFLKLNTKTDNLFQIDEKNIF